MTGRHEPPPAVKLEYIAMDGAEGEVLEERQLAVIKEVLAWLRQNPDQTSERRDRRAA